MNHITITLNILGSFEGKPVPAQPIPLKIEEQIGTVVELEHTSDEEEALRIALEHLEEDSNYYSKMIESGIIKEEIPLQIYQNYLNSL